MHPSSSWSGRSGRALPDPPCLHFPPWPPVLCFSPAALRQELRAAKQFDDEYGYLSGPVSPLSPSGERPYAVGIAKYAGASGMLIKTKRCPLSNKEKVSWITLCTCFCVHARAVIYTLHTDKRPVCSLRQGLRKASVVKGFFPWHG